VRTRQHRGTVELVREGENLLGDLPSGLHFEPKRMKQTQADQNSKHLGSLADSLT
jgi:hypothetical protein